jgi:mitogen-activated protein kinase 1/3
MNSIFLVMENEEVDLRVFMMKGQGLAFGKEHLATVTYNIMCALSFCHSSNVIHRDIKPSNILINSKCQVKLCDFGLSRTLPEPLIGKGSGNTKRVRDSVMKHQGSDDAIKTKIMGKLLKEKSEKQKKKRSVSSHVSSRWFRAPEIILLEKQYDQAIDMWAVGCIIFELIKFTNRAMDQNHQTTKGALFAGKYCFPLSPRGQNEENKD